MNGARWQYRDEGSGAPGHLQAVVPDGAYACYRTFTNHTMGCDDCEYGEARCEAAKRLWAEYVRRRDAVA